VAAGLLGQQHRIEQSRARASLRLADADAEHPGLRQCLPEGRVEAQRLGRADAGGARLGGEQLGERVAQQLLLLGQRQVHGDISSAAPQRPQHPVGSPGVSSQPEPHIIAPR
jgi:hypothetical protein